MKSVKFGLDTLNIPLKNVDMPFIYIQFGMQFVEIYPKSGSFTSINGIPIDIIVFLVKICLIRGYKRS